MLADEEEDDDEVGEVLTLPLQAHHAMEKMEEFVHKVNKYILSFERLKMSMGLHHSQPSQSKPGFPLRIHFGGSCLKKKILLLSNMSILPR